MDTNMKGRPRPGGRAPIDTGKLQAAYDAWAAADPRRSRRRLAQLTGMTVGHISGVLRGTHGISAARLRQITVELGVPVESVLRGDLQREQLS
jgi:transcriptional regulator with XRE-family HTH domain